MRHDNDVNAVTTVRAKVRRAAAYGLLAVVGTGALVMSAGPAAAQPTTPTTKPVSTAKPAATAKATPAPVAIHRSSKELPVKYKAQPNYYWCGPAATRNALSATGHSVTMASLARTMGTTEAGTNSAHDITAALNKVTHSHDYRTTELARPKVTAQQAKTLKRDIIMSINDNRAVVANVAGTATDTSGRSHSYEGGHYIAVHGYRDSGRQAEIADSADPHSAHYWIDTTDLAQWIATRGYSH